MTHPHPVDDIDPTAATSWEELATCLRWLRARADNISYRELERWGEEHQKPLPRTTLLEVLHGRRFPRKTLLLAFVEACGVDPATDTRWERTWNELNEQLYLGDASVPIVQVEDMAGSEERSFRPTDERPPEPAIPAEVWDKAQEVIRQARLSAKQIVSDAREEAGAVVERADADATAIRAAADLKAEQLVRDATERAERIVQDAGERGERIVRDKKREAEELWESVLQDLAVKVDERERLGLADWQPSPEQSTSGRPRWRFGR